MKKILFMSLSLFTCILAQEAPYPPSGYRPQGALLLLPAENRKSYNTPQPQSDEIENLEKAGENVMKELNQQPNSDTGIYYVYFPDGRLQRIQYRSAPYRSPSSNNNQQVNLQNSQTFQNSNTLQFNQQNAQANSKFQFPGQAFSQFGQSQQSFSQLRQREQFTDSPYNQKTREVYNEYGLPNQAAIQQNEYARYNQRQNFIKQQHLEKFQPENRADTSNPYSHFITKEPVQTFGRTIHAQELNPLVAQFGRYQYESLQQPKQHQISNWLSSVQYTDVQPITEPIYALNSSPLVRILRYAPQYQ